MKTKTKLLPLIILIITGIVIASCSKSEDPEPTPAYPQLVGTWMGFTGQNDTVLIQVTTANGKLNVYRYKYGITYQESGYYQRISSDISGQNIPFATDKSFAFSIGLTVSDSLTGVFNVSAMTLAGMVSRQFKNIAGQPIGVVNTAYMAVKQ